MRCLAGVISTVQYPKLAQHSAFCAMSSIDTNLGGGPGLHHSNGPAYP
jgi:hypothetical protein